MSPQAALRRTGSFARGARITATLHAATTKTSYLVERRGERFVLRVDEPLAARLGLDRRSEFAALRAAWRAGLAPEPVMLLKEAPAVLLLRYAPGRAWRAEDLRDRSNLDRVAALLRRVHALVPPVPVLDFGSALARYVALADGGDPASRAGQNDSSAAINRAIAADAVRLLRELRRGAGAPCLCHHDPVAGNVIGRRHTVLIDWEYAALGDPLFDLAVVAGHHGLPARAAAHLAAAYFGGAGRVPWARLATFRGLYDRVYALWLGAIGAGQALSPGQQVMLSRLRRRLDTQGGSLAVREGRPPVGRRRWTT